MAKGRNKQKQQNNVEVRQNEFWGKASVRIPLTLLCVFLWGTAFPFVKSGYRLFQIDNQAANSVFSMFLFAGLRFTLCGILTLLFTVLIERTKPFPKNRQQWLDSFLLAIPQTILQYSFFFVGMANTSGTIGSILAGSSSFMTVILAGAFLKNEKLSSFAVLGCLLGLGGVILVNINQGSAAGTGFKWSGEGLLLLSSLASAFALILSKKLTTRNQPRVLSGWNFLMGGLFLTLVGTSFGGELKPLNYKAWLVLLYLAMLSAAAFSIWTTLIKYHKVSKVSVYKSLIPVIGAIGSALILKEDILQLRLIIALILVVLGIVLVNQKNHNSKSSTGE